MTDLEPIGYDSTGAPLYRHQIADSIDPSVQTKLDQWFGHDSELSGYNEGDVKLLGRAVI